MISNSLTASLRCIRSCNEKKIGFGFQVFCEWRHWWGRILAISALDHSISQSFHWKLG